MKRIRWFNIDCEGLPLSGLPGRLRRFEYANDSGVGFRIQRASKGTAEGTFIERFAVEEEVEDPFGKVLHFKRIEFRRVHFNLVATEPNLEVVDPPRSLKMFFSQLSAAMDHRLTVSQVEPRVAPWLTALEKEVGRLRVRMMRIADVSMSPSIHAEAIVQGGDSDVRNAVTKLLDGRSGQVISASVTWRQGDETMACELTRQGAEYSEAHEDMVAPLLRQSLQLSLGK